MKCTYGEHPWHTRIGNLNIFDSRYFGCTAALDAEHYLQEIGALEGFYFPRIMEVNPSPVTPPAETLPSVQISVEHPNLATSIQYGVSSLPISEIKVSRLAKLKQSIPRVTSMTQHLRQRWIELTLDATMDTWTLSTHKI
ncbi:uncharacterized protein LOC114077870 isoform X5 [Solanum pennellii]|uniref:Uncharacterized protein LOC114077870 isoform X5 n=1 Tax=Solanum pennellii TaxID=28526 RepID=A0ABM1VE71_SOLPN|nr:uncharacterized protein LOC114077870 isoform X5 [Solanum pennellii]